MLQTAIFLGVLSFSLAVNALSSSPGNEISVRGCLSKSSTDYILTQADQGNSYQLQGDEIRLKSYLGKRVEITGTESPTLSTSEDAISKMGNASPVTITVQSIQTIAGECQNR